MIWFTNLVDGWVGSCIKRLTPPQLNWIEFNELTQSSISLLLQVGGLHRICGVRVVQDMWCLACLKLEIRLYQLQLNWIDFELAKLIFLALEITHLYKYFNDQYWVICYNLMQYFPWWLAHYIPLDTIAENCNKIAATGQTRVISHWNKNFGRRQVFYKIPTIDYFGFKQFQHFCPKHKGLNLLTTVKGRPWQCIVLQQEKSFW